MYYFVSSSKDLKELSPRVPNNFLTRIKAEDSTTPRVCVSTSVHNCLKALSMNLEGKKLYVYVVDEKDLDIKKPSVKEVPDARLTGEVWILQKAKLKLHQEIKVEKAFDKPESYTYTKDGKTYKAKLYSWRYKVIKEF